MLEGPAYRYSKPTDCLYKHFAGGSPGSVSWASGTSGPLMTVSVCERRERAAEERQRCGGHRVCSQRREGVDIESWGGVKTTLNIKTSFQPCSHSPYHDFPGLFLIIWGRMIPH